MDYCNLIDILLFCKGPLGIFYHKNYSRDLDNYLEWFDD